MKMKEKEEDNFTEYSIDDEQQEEILTLGKIWKIMFVTMGLPADGWNMLRDKNVSPNQVIPGFFIPLCILAALSNFFTLIYDSQLAYSDLFVNIVITFFSFFLGYYLAILMGRLLLPKADRDFPMTRFGRLMIIVGISTLLLFKILMFALPMFDFIIEFFPIWTVYLLYKGLAKSDLNENKISYSLGVICVVIIASPVLVEWLLSLLTPQSA